MIKTLAHPHKSTQLYSILMLLVSSTGVFLPLEVALNQVWGVRRTVRIYIIRRSRWAWPLRSACWR